MKRNSVQKKLVDNAGFSMVELIVVIAIMVALVAVVAVSVTGYVAKARFAVNVTNIRRGQEVIRLVATEKENTESALFLYHTGSGTCDLIESPGAFNTHGIDMENYDTATWDYKEMRNDSNFAKITETTDLDWYLALQSGSYGYIGMEPR
jgi:prepilin-type N-terminal cleavage/methylation domain-containing protein